MYEEQKMKAPVSELSFKRNRSYHVANQVSGRRGEGIKRGKEIHKLYNV